MLYFAQEKRKHRFGSDLRWLGQSNLLKGSLFLSSMRWWLQSLRISSIPCRGKCDFPGLLSLQSIPSPSTKPTSPQPSSKLFIGGLSYDTNETVLKDAFGAHGEIVEVKVICDHVTSQSKGYGFVQFTSEREASIALQLMDGQLLDGRNIRVDFANKGAKEIRNVQDK